MNTTIDNPAKLKKYFVDYTAIHVGGGQHEQVEVLSETEVDESTTEHEGYDLMSFKDAALELLDERYEQLAHIDEERRVVLAEIRALEEAESFQEYKSFNEKYQEETEVE